MSDPVRTSAPYIFYGQTTSLCETCLLPVPAKILIEGDDVFYQKRCPDHGVQKTLISTDARYFRQTKDYIKPGDRPLMVQTRTDYGCPFDCGLCPDHEQHSCLALIEINSHCNLSCPVCFADSSPQRQEHLSLDQIAAMMDALVASEGEPDVLQISGGEPTLHPEILEILAMARARPIRHLMLNTNGIRLAQDPDFVAALRQFTPGFEIYLQFDALDQGALMNLRGADLRRIRQQALAALEAAHIPVTLVVTVKKGVNDHQIGAIIDHALEWTCVRGITFQPVHDAGRNTDFDKNRDRFLLTDIRRAIYQQSSVFTAEDIIPLPCNPESIAIAYGLRQGRTILPVTGMIPQADLVAAVPNAVSFERDDTLRQKVMDLFSLSSGELNCTERMQSLLCCLPEVPDIDGLGYEHIFRITIVSFMDRFNFCVGGVKRSCIHFVTPAGQIIPFDTYNLFYRDGLVDRLRPKIAPLRQHRREQASS